ncbi:hypothetical protein D3C72_2384720 [compost metagenome]
MPAIAAGDEEITDVVLDALAVRLVIHGDEAGQVPVHLDQERLGRRLAPVVGLGL